MKDVSIIIVILLLMCLLLNLVYYKGYRTGQINALNGNIEYELVKQSDGSVDWEFISPSADHQEKSCLKYTTCE